MHHCSPASKAEAGNQSFNCDHKSITKVVQEGGSDAAPSQGALREDGIHGEDMFDKGKITRPVQQIIEADQGEIKTEAKSES